MHRSCLWWLAPPHCALAAVTPTSSPSASWAATTIVGPGPLTLLSPYGTSPQLTSFSGTWAVLATPACRSSCRPHEPLLPPPDCHPLPAVRPPPNCFPALPNAWVQSTLSTALPIASDQASMLGWLPSCQPGCTSIPAFTNHSNHLPGPPAGIATTRQTERLSPPQARPRLALTTSLLGRMPASDALAPIPAKKMSIAALNPPDQPTRDEQLVPHEGRLNIDRWQPGLPAVTTQL